MNPPPTTTAVLALWSAIHERMRRESGIVRTAKMPGKSTPGSSGRIGAAPGDKHQRIVSLRASVGRTEIARRDHASVAIDASHFGVGVYLDIEPLVKHLSRGHQQPALIRNDIADVVRQSAVCERNVRAAIEHDDLNGFVKPPQSRRTRGATCYTADNEHATGRARIMRISRLRTVCWIIQPPIKETSVSSHIGALKISIAPATRSR